MSKLSASIRALPMAFGIGGLGSCICCTRAPTRRSSTSKGRVAPHRKSRSFASWLASAYALKGETARGAAELAEARSLVSDDSYSSIAREKAGGIFRMAAPKVRDLFETTYYAGLRKVGMSEE